MIPVPKRKMMGAAAHNRAPQHERDVAKRLPGAKLTKASGAQNEKGDVRVRGVARIECKCTSAKSFSVTREMIEKIENAATTAGELPMIEIEMLPQRPGEPVKRVAVLPSWALDMLLGGDA